ncbi:MAG: glycosyltransferase family 39 protein [Caldilineales bacterium]|nr:glycosyltransferase family 39 protein [Caldilineales bacterium]
MRRQPFSLLDVLALAGLLALAAGLRFVALGRMPLIGDEAYYWLWSQRPALAYYDHPAGVAWLIRLSTALGGQGEVGIRWLNAALGAGLAALAFDLASWGNDAAGRRRRAGLLAAALAATAAPLLIVGRFVYPDALLLFLLLLNLGLFWRMAEQQPEPSWPTALAFGGSLALLFNTKYIAYLYAAVLLALVLRYHRPLLRSRRAWAAAGLGLLGLLPVLIWNAGHGWASLRWQLSHAVGGVGGGLDPLRNARHAWMYLTWPVVLATLLGLGRPRSAVDRSLLWLGVALALPVLLSPADSPRSLLPGALLLLILAARRLADPSPPLRRPAVVAATALVLATALYGAGTVLRLAGRAEHPLAALRSSGVGDVRRDSAGWRDLGAALAGEPTPLFSVDYSAAGQLAYYSGRPAATSWGQYRLWGFPQSDAWTVVSRSFVPPALIEEQLGAGFAAVSGPDPLIAESDGVRQTLHVWRAAGRRWTDQEMADALDFLRLWQEVQR